MTNLRKQIIEVLEKRDGLCMDVESERELLAHELARNLAADRYVVPKVEGGLISAVTIWSALDQAKQDAREFLACADVDTDDAVVLRMGHDHVELVLTSKQLLDA